LYYNIYYVNIALASCGTLAEHGGAGRKGSSRLGAGLYPLMTTPYYMRGGDFRKFQMKVEIKKKILKIDYE